MSNGYALSKVNLYGKKFRIEMKPTACQSLVVSQCKLVQTFRQTIS